MVWHLFKHHLDTICQLRLTSDRWPALGPSPNAPKNRALHQCERSAAGPVISPNCRILKHWATYHPSRSFVKHSRDQGQHSFHVLTAEELQRKVVRPREVFLLQCRPMQDVVLIYNSLMHSAKATDPILTRLQGISKHTSCHISISSSAARRKGQQTCDILW